MFYPNFLVCIVIVLFDTFNISTEIPLALLCLAETFV